MEALCDAFERLPLHFMRFHAATNVDDVIDAMEFAHYVHDVEHVVLDNLQFMTQSSTSTRSFDKWGAQDEAIAKFRDFATKNAVHVVLVVHPRKEDPHARLALTSIYGGAKAAQEADNVIILQAPLPPPVHANGHHAANGQQHSGAAKPAPNAGPKWVEVVKNRYAGLLGSVMMAYSEPTCRYYELAAGHHGAVVSPPAGIANAEQARRVVEPPPQMPLEEDYDGAKHQVAVAR